MLEKELSQAVKLAERANREVEKMRKRLLSETEKAVARGKRELATARKRQSTANARLKRARASLRTRPSTDNKKKVDELVKQAKQLAATTGKIARAVADVVERWVPMKTDAILEARKAAAANRAADMVERAAKRAKKKPAAKKKAAPKRKAAKKKAAPKRKAAPKKKR